MTATTLFLTLRRRAPEQGRKISSVIMPVMFRRMPTVATMSFYNFECDGGGLPCACPAEVRLCPGQRSGSGHADAGLVEISLCH